LTPLPLKAIARPHISPDTCGAAHTCIENADETYFSAKQNRSRPPPWFPRPDVDSWWPPYRG
jgi:hypothetical protein